MGYGDSGSVSLGASVGSSLSSEKPRPGSSWLFFAWPVRERLADI